MSFHRLDRVKPDGRRLLLYARQPLDPSIEAPEPPGGMPEANPHLRWHPLRREWVAYAGHRQDRTFLPPPEWNPLAPTVAGREPTELPDARWEIAVFENRFPTLVATAHDPPGSIVPTRPATGTCEVIVYGRDREVPLAELPLDRIELLIEVWADRTEELGRDESIRYVMPFENRGTEVGATLDHPHGQLYAYPFVPPVPAAEQAAQREHWEREGRGQLATLIDRELADGRRTLYVGPRAVAFVPAWARYAYEVWVMPRQPVPDLTALDAATRADLARALGTVLRAYDALREAPFAYVLVCHQAPCDGEPHPEWHLHLELYPPARAPGRLKYLAGTELGAGTFANDALPEEKAAELRAARDRVEALT